MPNLSVNPDVKKPGEKVRLFSIGGASTTLHFRPPQCYRGEWLLFGECRFLLRPAPISGFRGKKGDKTTDVHWVLGWWGSRGARVHVLASSTSPVPATSEVL